MMLGTAVQAGQVKPALSKGASFYWFNLAGALQKESCKTVKECKSEHLQAHIKNRIFSPCMIMQGNKVVYTRGVLQNNLKQKMQLSYGGFDIQQSIEQWMIGQVMFELSDGKMAHQGSAWNIKSYGFSIQQFFKKKYMFYVFHTRVTEKAREMYSWKFFSNSLYNAKAWYSKSDQFWQKGAKNSATAMFIKTNKGMRVIEMMGSSSFKSKAIIVGKAFYSQEDKQLDPGCFAKFAAKGEDFTVYASKGQNPESKYYSGHKPENFHTWRKEMEKQDQNSLIFWPKPHGKGYHLEFWGKNSARQDTNGWTELLGRFLMKNCEVSYVRGVKEVGELGLPMM